MAASLVLDAYEVSGSVNVENNTSRLVVRLQITTTGGTYNHAGDTVGSITVNGNNNSLDGKNVDYNTTTTLFEGTYTITHDTDGAKSVTITAEFDPNTPGTSRMTVSKTVKLTDIPRASTLAATDANIGAVSMVAVNRRSTNYRHSIAYSFGDLSGYLKADGSLSQTEVKLTGTSIAFPVPESFYDQIPDSPSGVCTLICTTYLGSARVGEPQSATFTATADIALCAPVATLTVTEADEKIAALTGGEHLVRYASTARCVLDAAPRNGASLKEFSINGVEGDTLLIPGVECERFTYHVTDSRGYSRAGSIGVPMAEYLPLTAALTAGRTDPTSGNARLSVSGNYLKAQFGQAENELTLHCTVGDTQVPLVPTFTGRSYKAVADVSGLDYRKNHTVRVTVADKVCTLELTATIGKGVPVFHWGEEDFQFNVPVGVPEPTADEHAVNRQYAQGHFLSADGAPQLTSPVSAVGESLPSFVIRKEKDGDDMVKLTFNPSTRNTFFSVYNPDMDGKDTRYAERFLLPLANAGRQSNVNYDMLTSKTPVTVKQGGTGATNAATARINLGIGCAKLLSGAGTINITDNFKAFLVLGTPGQNSSIMSLLIPVSELSATPTRWQIADNVDYVSFNARAASGMLAIQKAAGNGSITAVYGIN